VRPDDAPSEAERLSWSEARSVEHALKTVARPENRGREMLPPVSQHERGSAV
jgi:hypothetical protein